MCKSNNSICGVYIILHKDSGRVYVGSSRDIRARMHTHFNSLKMGRHGNPYLQSIWNKYGRDSFEFKIVAICSEDKRVLLEKILVDSFMSMNRGHGFNLRHPVTMKHSEETKRKIGEMKRGKKINLPPRTLQHTINLGKAFRSRKLTEEHKAKIRAAAKRGDDSPTCKYPDSVCRKVIFLFRSGITRGEIANQLGVPVGFVERVIRGVRKFSNRPEL